MIFEYSSLNEMGVQMYSNYSNTLWILSFAVPPLCLCPNCLPDGLINQLATIVHSCFLLRNHQTVNKTISVRRCLQNSPCLLMINLSLAQIVISATSTAPLCLRERVVSSTTLNSATLHQMVVSLSCFCFLTATFVYFF